MTQDHALSSQEVGMIRIYMKPRDRDVGARRSLFGGNVLYRGLVRRAKRAGVMNAVAHHTHYGYSNHGRIQDEGAEISNPELTMCVELIAPREMLERFCRENGAALRDKVIIYKHLEHWKVETGD